MTDERRQDDERKDPPSEGVRIIEPSLVGLTPRSELRIAVSISPSDPLS